MKNQTHHRPPNAALSGLLSDHKTTMASRRKKKNNHQGAFSQSGVDFAMVLENAGVSVPRAICKGKSDEQNWK